MSAKHTIDQVQQVQGKGKGMIRQIYWHMKGEQQRPAWNCLMFNNAARPKAYFTMWIILNQKLVTVDRLVQWGVAVDKNSVLCMNTEESIEHLFLQCQYARKLWERLLGWIDQQSAFPMTWGQFLQWSTQHGKEKSTTTQIFTIVLAEGVYGVWIERNNKIIEHKSKMEENTAKEIAYVTIARASPSIKNVVRQWKF
ncbi:uncharacterized protein LOC107024782 [Solanum pennellii]|uniref:Uncharacterized protein LOC107024782 n=1 Tax=Solanum pennellii TaxID=28526 RepID=A0ABM1H704_SOLPN|nr:uncharacterized protein LOC107024782 [Solanum pennellii]